MPNYRLTLSYDGTNRPGWQRLAPNDRSIQGRLEAALTELFGQPVEVNGSGRTDADLGGTHDFTSFCVRGKKSAVRTLTELSVRREGDALTLTFSADGFLHHMVRILTGTLLEVGLGKRPAGSMPALLAEKRRAAAGQTAPAAGLCLMEVRYE